MARYRVGLETRERILEATRELLADQAPDEVTLKAITDRAGVGAGSFYNLFESKDEVVVEVVRAAIAAVDPDPSGLGRETVTDLVHAFVAFFVDPRTAIEARIYLQLAVAGALTDRRMAGRVRRHHEARVERFSAALRREHHRMPPAEARERAELLLGALVGAAMLWLLDDTVDLRSRARRLAALAHADV